MVVSLPTVTIGMPVYNGERYLRETLNSLLAQDYTNLEIYISDNGSTDHTEQICRGYAGADSRIQYRRDEVNRGAIANFNHVARSGCSKYFMWAGDHDLWHPAFVSRCVEVLERFPTVVLCYPQAVWIDCGGGIGDIIPPFLDTRGLGPTSRLQVVTWGLGYCYQVYGIFKTDALKSTALFRNIVAPDLLLLTELSLVGEFACVSEPLLRMRRLTDHGNWQSYMRKLGVGKATRVSAIYLFSEMMFHHLDVIRIHSPRMIPRIFRMMSVMTCIMAKYKWIARGLLSASTK